MRCTVQPFLSTIAIDAVVSCCRQTTGSADLRQAQVGRIDMRAPSISSRIPALSMRMCTAHDMTLLTRHPATSLYYRRERVRSFSSEVSYTGLVSLLYLC